MIRPTRLASLLALVLTAAPLGAVRAQAAPDDLDAMSLEDLLNLKLTVASKDFQKQEDAPGSLTVITRQQIADMSARSLRDVLNVFVPGMDVVPTYFLTGDPVNEGIYSRGLLSPFSQQILILVDGKNRFREPMLSSPFEAMDISLDQIEQVEVSRSPVPIYGGGAAVVINLVTRRAQGLSTIFEAGWGNLDDVLVRAIRGVHASGAWGGNMGSWRYYGSVGYTEDAGSAHPSAEGRGNYSLDPALLRNGTPGGFDASFLLGPSAGWFDIGINVMQRSKDPFLFGPSATQSNGPCVYSSDVYLLHATLRPLPSLEISSGTQYDFWGNGYDDQGTAIRTSGGGAFDFFEVRYAPHLSLGGEHSLSLGVRGEDETASDVAVDRWEGGGFVPVNNPQTNSYFRDVFAAWAEDSWRIADVVTAVAGGRADYYYGFGEARDLSLNPRVALTWDAQQHLAFKALFASSTRTPSVYERNGDFRGILRGSPDIKPERVQTAELSAIVKARGLRAQVTPFYEQLHDKIEFIPRDTSGLLYATNNGDTSVVGADADGRYYFDTRNYTFVNGTALRSWDEREQHLTYFLPRLYLNGGVNLSRWDWNLNLTASLRGPRDLPPELVSNRLYASGPTFVANLALSYTPTPNIRVFARLENLTGQLNAIPLSVDGYFVPMGSRCLWVGFSYSPAIATEL